jgi:hypothetical protein
MQLLDVNILVNAFREDATDHPRFARWLAELAASGATFSASELVLSSFLRIVTNARIFRPATPRPLAFAFAEAIRSHPSYVRITAGPRHWEIFVALCDAVDATADLIPDAYHAALAIEHGCEWMTADKHFARFPGLRWRHPLD